jgi:hypothetical protein
METTPNASTGQLPSPQEKRRGDALALCDELSRDFQERANRHKRTFKFLRYASVTFAITVTVISTLTATQGTYLWIVPVVSGLSALCTTLLSATNSQERWVHSRGVEQQLKAENSYTCSMLMPMQPPMKKRTFVSFPHGSSRSGQKPNMAGLKASQKSPLSCRRVP